MDGLLSEQPGQDQQQGKHPLYPSSPQQVIITFPAAGTLPTDHQIVTETNIHPQQTDKSNTQRLLSDQPRPSNGRLTSVSGAPPSNQAVAQGPSQRTICILLSVAVMIALIGSYSRYNSSSSSSSMSASSSWQTSVRSPEALGVDYASDALPPNSGGQRSSRSSFSSSDDSSGSSGCVSSSGCNSSTKCPYGSLPGTWVAAAAAAGAHWQVLDPDCQLTNWLEVYTDAAAAAAMDDSSRSSSSSSDDSTNAQDSPQPVRILLLSDSVDRYIIQHVCDHIGGTKQTHSMQPTPAAEAAEAAAEQLRQQQQPDLPALQQTSTPTSLNKTAYAFHTCSSAAPIKLASSYFPGVHPTGPYHRYSAQNYKQRIDSAREMWTQYAGAGNEPDMVSVASLLWDVARIFMHEREKLEGREYLERDVLDGWLFNFTQVVEYAKDKFPEV